MATAAGRKYERRGKTGGSSRGYGDAAEDAGKKHEARERKVIQEGSTRIHEDPRGEKRVKVLRRSPA